MIKLPSPETVRVTPGAFWLAAILTLTLLLASAQLGLAQVTIQIWSGQATVSTANCNSSGGICQGNPACNNGAGPNPDTIQATVTLCEVSVDSSSNSVETACVSGLPCPNRKTGTLTVRGTGSGFRPGVTYVSLLYQNPNTATCSRFPAGVAPTLQNLAQADSDFASMHLGFWVVKDDGTATLTVDKEATLQGLNNYKTVSVREMQPPNAACFNCGLDPAPQLNALRACGALTVVATSNCSLP